MAAADIRRLIAPRSIALIGAGAWTDAVAAGNGTIGYTGTLWRVHPSRPSTATTTYYRSIDELPGVPDSTFVAVPNTEAPRVAAALANRGAGGFVCFSAGFSETGTEVGSDLTRALSDNAAHLPFFGPNCYGFVNYFDRVAMMPDQIVGASVERGVALICQSGTIALTLMYNDRSLPIGYLFSVGNQTRLAVEDLIEMLCVDDRVTAFGLYVEGVKDPQRFARAAAAARAAGKPIALIKSGRTAAAARTAHSHTGALVGADSVFDAFCRQSGIARCDTLGTLCETLKLFHAGGPLAGRKILMIGTSGGDMAMTADVSRELDLEFPPIPESNAATLQTLLSDRVTIANPLDIHTYLWFDPAALKNVFYTALRSGFDAVGFMLDCPPQDKADTASFDAVIDVYIEAAQAAPSRAMLVASLPETMGSKVRKRCLEGGVVPLQGLLEGLGALAMAADVGAQWAGGAGPDLHRGAANANPTAGLTLREDEGKAALAAYGVRVPRGRVVNADNAAAAAVELGFPVAMKAASAQLVHKSDAGGVILNIRSPSEATNAAMRLAKLSPDILVEEMFDDGVAEILIGVTVDPQFGQILALGSGGVFTELLADSVTLLPPWNRTSIGAALERLSVAKLLRGYRGKPPGDLEGLLAAVLGVAEYATDNAGTLIDMDVNPVIVLPQGRGAVAVDTLIRHTQDPDVRS